VCRSAGRILSASHPPSSSAPPSNPHSARCTTGAQLPATSCLGAFWTPAATARGRARHAGVQKPAQQETRLIGALHVSFKISRWSRWLACPRTIETHESVEPRRYLEPPPSHGTQSMDELSAPLTCLSKKKSDTSYQHRRLFSAHSNAEGECIAGLKKEGEMHSRSQEIESKLRNARGEIRSRPGARSS